MNWTSAAILSAAIWALVSTIDSHIISKRLPGLRTFLLMTGSLQLIYGAIALYLIPLSRDIGILPLLAAIASGTLRTTSVCIMFYNLRREEVSRVVPIYYTSPIFVAIIAVLLLGESLGYAQWLAIIIVVTGSAMISLEKRPSSTNVQSSRPFLLLFAASLIFAVSDIAAKYALNYISFWNMYIIFVFTMCLIFLAISLRPSTIKQLKEIKQRRSTITMIICSELGVPIAMTLQYWAMAGGQISLVSTILGTRPVFVAIYSILLGFIMPGFLLRSASRGVIALRFLATVMIVGGVSIIYLT